MQIGRKIYFDKITGNVIVDKGEMQSDVRETTQAEDFVSYVALAERVPETVGVVQLEYGQYDQDFAECNGYRVNITTKTLEFSYPDPSIPVEEPVYQKPLTEQILELETKTDNAIIELTMLIALGGTV